MAKHNRKVIRRQLRRIQEQEASARAKARKYAKRAGGEVKLPPKEKPKTAYGNPNFHQFANALEKALSV